MTISRERLTDLLVSPQEDLNFEVKNWLDLQNSNEDKATLAKAILAIANHGGGYIVLGLRETEAGLVEAERRPDTLDGYGQDLINGIAHHYCDPQFHCTVQNVPNPAGALFPIVVVPGGHRVPIRARRAGPNGNTVQSNAIYVRKAGPRSETPQSAQDWDTLLTRCFLNRRDEFFDQIRVLMTGAVPQLAEVPEPARLDEWISASRARWRLRVADVPENAGPRLPHGRFFVAYEIIGERRIIALADLPRVLRASIIRHTGWPPFWYPNRDGIAPYPMDGAVECWLGGNPGAPFQNRDAAHSDFWRINPDGFAFLLRGYQEDGWEIQTPRRPPVEPATLFDLTLPIWRMAEVLLHARSLASNLFEGPTTINLVAGYEGLAGRRLVSLVNDRNVEDNHICFQDSILLRNHIDTQSIESNLPEIIQPLLSPLYGLFGFYELTMRLVVGELNRMMASRQ